MKRQYNAVFRCINLCSGSYPLDEVIYQCPGCGDLLEVVHDLAALRTAVSPIRWKSLFEERYMRNIWPFGSGVWGKKEFVCPNVEDKNIVSTCEGGTNLFYAERLGERWGLDDLWIKQCGIGHTGSFKDLGMTVLVSMVKQMRADGKNIPAVACASTGDTSAALAAYSAVAGIPCIVFLPKGKISQAQLVQPLANNAITIAVDSDFDGCMEIVKEITSRQNIYLANSMNSLRIEGQKTISFEICQQFGWEVPDWIIVPGGNLGNVSAIGAGFLMMRDVGLIDRLPRICCAQAQSANPLYQSYLSGFETFEPKQARNTWASAIQIGNPVSYKKAIRVLQKMDGIVEQASEEEIWETAGEADRTGLYNCPQTGVALAALKKLVAKREVKRSSRVIVISTAHGLKFTSFKSAQENRVHELPAEYAKVEEFILRTFDNA